MEGDVFEMSVSSWDDPDRNTGAPFTITVDWGDGTTSQQTVAGTNDDATTFEVSHRYTTELDLATLSYCIHTDSGQLVACFERRNAISIGNMRPFVNAADLSTWPQDHEGLRSEEHTSELQSLMRISYAVLCLKKKKIE